MLYWLCAQWFGRERRFALLNKGNSAWHRFSPKPLQRNHLRLEQCAPADCWVWCRTAMSLTGGI